MVKDRSGGYKIFMVRMFYKELTKFRIYESIRITYSKGMSCFTQGKITMSKNPMYENRVADNVANKSYRFRGIT